MKSVRIQIFLVRMRENVDQKNSEYGHVSRSDRYNDPQFILSYHMNHLLNLENISSLTELKKLRRLHGEIETQVRSLNTI